MRYQKDKNGKVINVEFDKPGSYSRVIRYNSPEYVVKLAKYIKDKYNANYLYFLDENLMTMDFFQKDMDERNLQTLERIRSSA